MAVFRRSPRLPDDVRARLPLAPGEKVAAAAPVTDGWAVATNRALHVARDGAGPTARPWHEVDAARLDPETHVLRVVWVDGTTTDLELTELRDVRFAREVHGRVQSSVVHHERVEVGLTSARVALRRDSSGELFVQVVAPAGVDLSAPAVAARIATAEARVREAAGAEVIGRTRFGTPPGIG